MNKTAEALLKLDINIKAKVAEEELFGSITQPICKASSLGYEVDKRFVKLSSIKELGKYEAEIRLHRTVRVTVPFNVVAE